MPKLIRNIRVRVLRHLYQQVARKRRERMGSLMRIDTITIRRIFLLGTITLIMSFRPAMAGQEAETGSRNEPQKPTDDKIQITKSLISTEAGKPVFQQRNPRYKLRYGDVFELKFPITPEFDQPKVTVHPDGYVTLTGISDLHVEGKTEEELAQALRSAYAKILKDPIISINLVDFEKPYFIVGGQVGKPGRYDMRGDTSAFQAVQMAGGFTKDAKHSQVLLLRRVSDEWGKVTLLDMKKMENIREFAEDPHLQPGDMVLVPKSFFGKTRDFIRWDQLIWMT